MVESILLTPKSPNFTNEATHLKSLGLGQSNGATHCLKAIEKGENRTFISAYGFTTVLFDSASFCTHLLMEVLKSGITNDHNDSSYFYHDPNAY